MQVLTVGVTILTCCVCAMVFTDNQSFVTAAFAILHLGYLILIIYGVIGIRDSIKTLSRGATNNKLTTIHIVNFVVFSCLFIGRTLLQIKC